jgi:hypothetical protein
MADGSAKLPADTHQEVRSDRFGADRKVVVRSSGRRSRWTSPSGWTRPNSTSRPSHVFSNHVPCDADITLVAAVHSTITNHSLLARLLILHDADLGGGISQGQQYRVGPDVGWRDTREQNGYTVAG